MKMVNGTTLGLRKIDKKMRHLFYNRLIINISVLVILTTATISIGASYNKGENMEIDYKKAVNIAGEFIQGKGFDLQKMGLVYDINNENWNKYYLTNELFVKYHNELLNILKNKHYWAIHYVPKKTSAIIKGGGIWVFIDKTTGEVIQHLIEK